MRVEALLGSVKNMQKTYNLQTGGVKFVLGWLVVFAVRLFPWRPPNVEPILATLMPFAKGYGPLPAFMFGALSIALFDVAVGKVGSWTVVTALSYGALGILSHYLLSGKTGRMRYVFVIVGIFAYDLVTGVFMGPLMFGMTLPAAFFGQIPFTLWHLAGTIPLAFILSPALERWLVASESLELPVVARRFGFIRG
jgi:uncharacterized membrane protein